MTMEFSVGRAAQASPIRMYQKLEKPGCKWGIFGIASLIGNIALMAFYTVVTGWIIYYFIKFLTGQNADFGFTQMITNPTVNVRAGLRCTPNGKFHRHGGQTQHDQTNNVQQHKTAAAVLAAHPGEFPHIAAANGAAG